jgi:CelD/BcsL family acetyltransferase involved in cellulose biosynthesis
VGQYDEMLLDPGCDALEAFAAAREALLASARPDLILLERVRADGALRPILAEAAPLGAAEGAPYADLSDGMAEFIKTLKSRVVRQQKKRVRRFEEEGCVGFEIACGAEQASEWLSEAMEMKREWLRSTGRFSRAFLKSETVDCLSECARTLAAPEASPRMVVSRLTLDGRTAAIEMGFCQRGAYHLYLGAFAADLAKFGPGNILTEKLLGWCAENGIARYDMLAPRSRNKAEWQSGEVEVFDFALALSWRGRLYSSFVLGRLRPAVRRAFYAMPARFRSCLAGMALRNLRSSPGAART